ncbi:right-handed parallel beta-helix repeat-containing protein [Candidatus Bathyarchaeota archaeon]|nr:right-handed parallel beta-helix repeat-containing protein [Candidatus Bathyarchaeota archaeon]
MKNFGLKTMLVIVQALLLCVLITVVLDTHVSYAMSTIYIRANGAVEPSTAPISSVNNITYVLTNNINDSIVIERDNIILDGRGCTIQGIGSGNGIDLTSRINVTIENMKIENFTYGIYLAASSSITIFNNTITGNIWDGIYALYTDTSTIYGNTISLNKRYGIALSESGNNRIFHNSFIDNTNQTHIFASFGNVWDDDYPLGGNYWSDYEEKYPNATETDGSGIWNTPYVIDAYNMDRYPLIIPEFSTATVILLLTTTFILVTILTKKKMLL